MGTFKYILKRLAFAALTFFIIISICYLLVRMLPNPVVAQLGKDYDLLVQQRVKQGLLYPDGTPVPLMEQYYNFFTRTLIGFNWGMSEKLYPSQMCIDIFMQKLPNTVMLNTYSALMAVPLGLLLGIVAALKKNRWQDHVISTGVMVMVSVPSYVYAFLIQYVLCFTLGWFPMVMDATTNLFTFATFKSMFPAVIALSLGSIAGYARFTRAELTEVLTSDYLLLARTKGLTRAQTTLRHALRNAMVPIFPSIISEVIAVLGGSLIIESIFGVPGVGPLYVGSITAKDYNFFILLSTFYTLIGLVAGIVVDLSYGIIDPRIRMGSKK